MILKYSNEKNQQKVIIVLKKGFEKRLLVKIGD